ncbi:MAG: EAL domain-containing protein [bacterium]|nr:EAL domain-containing protein [bacterium]
MTNDFDKQPPALQPPALQPPALGEGETLCKSEDTTPSASTVWFLAGPMNPNQPVRHVPVHTTRFVVGRANDNTLCLSSRTVSSVHAEFVCTDTSLTVRDLNSTNGTYVNGQRVADIVDLAADDLVQFGDVAYRVLKHSSEFDVGTLCEDVTDQALALVQFDRLMTEEAVIPHYQPIVDLRHGEREPIIAFEVLVRSRIGGLETPARMFSTAAQLSLEIQLSQMIRRKAIQETRSAASPPHLFLNTHPKELEHPGLIESMQSARELNQSQQITLEIHEKAIANAGAMKELRAALRDLDIGLAFDDFGAGQARLAELSEVQPDYIKFDMSLIRSIHEASPERRQMLGTLVRMVREMAVLSLAEGIECKEERDVCVELGFETAQGYYFGKPSLLGK